MKRISKDQYYIGIALSVSKRSTCIRRQYGSVVVKDDKIIGTGYNGSPRGCENCCDVGVCTREVNKIPHGERYEECSAVHSEQNALFRCDWNDLQGAVLYLYGEENGCPIYSKPCKICSLHIINSGITRVVCSNADGTFTEIIL